MHFIRLLRPHHYLKNGLIFVPLFFAGALFDGEKFFAATLAFLGFSFVASAMYIFNDIRDCAHDARHPKKRFRPIASGRISVPRAYSIIALLLLLSLPIFFFLPQTLPALGAYLLLNVLYSLFLKRVPIVDILAVASFYLLRVICGGVATDTSLSAWIILATICLALFVVIAKRRAEYGHEETARRSVLAKYSKELLDHLLSISAVLAIIVYALHSVLVLSSPYAVYTVIPVIAGIFWFLYRVYTSLEAEYPEKMLFKDPVLFAIFSIWGLSLVVMLYL